MSFKDYLVDNLGYDYKDIGHQYIFHCPFCYKNHDYKFYVKARAEGDKPEGLWQCKRCWKAGNPVSFVMEYEGKSFREAKEILELYGIDEDEFFTQAREEGISEEEALYLMLMGAKSEDKEVKIEKTPPPLPKGFKLITDNLDNPEVIPFLNYLINKRQIDAKMIPLHNIGYVTNGKAETQSGKKITLKNHLVFLTYDNQGNYKYWNTRSIEKDPYLKSINASGKHNEYNKADVVFNLNLARHEPSIVLTEGVLDAMTVGPSGVAGFGKQYSKSQIEQILNEVTSEQEIYILLDRDAVTRRNADGISTVDKLAAELYKEHENTFIVVPETDDDPNDLGTERVWDLIKNKSLSANPEGRILAYMI